MNYKNYFLVLSLFLTSCASNPWESSEVSEVFVTDIKSSGLKIFNYSLTRVTPQNGGSERGGSNSKGSGKHGGRGGKNGSGHGGMGRGTSVDESGIKLYFNEKLESKLKKTGYCQDGYIELDSSFGRGLLKIRGECEEAATEEDRIKFAHN
jgi:hypothetical protein